MANIYILYIFCNIKEQSTYRWVGSFNLQKGFHNFSFYKLKRTISDMFRLTQQLSLKPVVNSAKHPFTYAVFFFIKSTNNHIMKIQCGKRRNIFRKML